LGFESPHLLEQILFRNHRIGGVVHGALGGTGEAEGGQEDTSDGHL
jgi:hypothetical protein